MNKVENIETQVKELSPDELTGFRDCRQSALYLWGDMWRDHPSAIARTLIASLFLLGVPASVVGAPQVNAVVNGASFAQGPLAPGTIISIFGTGFSRATVSASALPLPASLDGTTVTISNQSVPLFFVSPTQINGQIPFRLQSGQAQLAVRDSTGATGSRTISIAGVSPGVFTTTADGKGDAIAVHADFKLVRKAVLEYARIGETIILFCTGLGAVQNFDTPGVASPFSPLATTAATPTILMDGRPAQVTFSGLAPGFVGLYQINLVVPSGVGGDVVLTIRVGETLSNEARINVAGVYTIGENYAGPLEYRTGGRFRLELNSFSSLSATSFRGSYRVLQGSVVVDAGRFEVQSTETVFVGFGQSTTLGGRFVAIMDTLDAGRSFLGILYDVDSPEKIRDPDSWYAGFEVSVSVPAPPPPPPAVLPGIPTTCAAVEGALIFADDGTFLGRITSNTFAADSIGNPFGRYGSEFSSTSIFNRFGPYGSEFSPTSAFNEFATRPPIIFLNNRAVAFLTVNPTRTPRIDPRALFPCIGRR